MALKTRYLQLSDTTMFEYSMHGESGAGSSSYGTSNIFLCDLKDGHVAVVSPVSCECELFSDSD